MNFSVRFFRHTQKNCNFSVGSKIYWQKNTKTHRVIISFFCAWEYTQKKCNYSVSIFKTHRKTMHTHREIAIILWVFLTHRKNDTGTVAWYRIEKRQKHPKLNPPAAATDAIPNAPPRPNFRRDCSHSRSTVAPGSKSAARRTRPLPSAHSPLAARR